MLFTSLEFVVFIVVFLPTYYLLPLRPRLLWVLGASYVFYGWWDWRYCGLLLLSSASAFVVATRIGRTDDPRAARAWLWLGLLLNLGMLAAFKYADFVVGTVGDALHVLGLEVDLPTPGLALPIGISFYVFQAVGYLIDVHRRTIAPETSFVRLGAFIALFPQLVAGPILRAGALLPQLRAPLAVTWAGFGRGLELIAWGFFLKLCLADNAAPLVDRRFARPLDFGGGDHLLGTFLFAFQIYGDFAGYSLIAIGLGRLMGYDFGINFRRPYFATSFRDFWGRWHISLSTWLRDYLYIPLGGNRHGMKAASRNLLITMLLGGLWHGPAWTFVVWGGLHGLYLVAERLLVHRFRFATTAPLRRLVLRALAAPVVFLSICLAWVFFRAESLADAHAILARILAWAPSQGVAGFEQWHLWRAVVALGCVLTVDAAAACTRHAAWRAPVGVRVVALAALVWMILLIGRFEGAEFIYFRF
ncbi:MAG TPA: MBOAT family O-acyltransferase [Geminicoccaceae bacterium]|nr:MBOAT family O-acyltransferase [Geminicoccaceae bacterium]